MENLLGEGGLKKVTIYPIKKKKKRKRRITKLVRIETHDLDFLKYYADENDKTLSKMLSDILYFYEIGNM